jgi:hypothetical protein
MLSFSFTTSSARIFQRRFSREFSIRTWSEDEKEKKITFTFLNDSRRVSQFVFQHWIVLSFKKATRVTWCVNFIILLCCHSICQLNHKSKVKFSVHSYVWFYDMYAMSLIKTIEMDTLEWIKSNVINSIRVSEARETRKLCRQNANEHLIVK